MLSFLNKKKTKEEFEVSYFNFSEIEDLLQDFIQTPKLKTANNSDSKSSVSNDNDLFSRHERLKQTFASHLHEDGSRGKFAGFNNKEEFEKFCDDLTSHFEDLGLHPRQISKEEHHVLIGITMTEGFEAIDPFDISNKDGLMALSKALPHGTSKEHNVQEELSGVKDDNSHLANLSGQQKGFKLTIRNLEEKLAEINKNNGENSVEASMVRSLIEEAKEKSIIVSVKIYQENQRDKLQQQREEELKQEIIEILVLEDKYQELVDLFGEKNISLEDLIEQKDSITLGANKGVEEEDSMTH